jgi:hypothetical protein
MKLSKTINKLKSPQAILSVLLQFSIVLLSVAYPLLYPGTANATLTLSYVRFDRQSATAALSGTVCMKSSQTAPGVAKVIVQFPSTFNLAGTDTQWTNDVTATNLPNTTYGDAFTATAWPVTGTSLKVLSATTSAIFLVGDLASSANTYCFHFTGFTGSTVGTAGTNLTGTVTAYKSDAAGGAVVESFAYATTVTTGTNSEQVQVTASVSATFSFALSGGDASHNLPLGVLNSASTVTAPYQITATISTNAHNGFLSWVKGTNADGLHSVTAGGTGITSPGSYPTITDLASNNGYGIFALTGTNSPNIAAGFTPTNGTTVGHVDSTQFDLIASLTGQQSGTTFNIGARAKPLSTQLAATDYSDTLTVIAAGSF